MLFERGLTWDVSTRAAGFSLYEGDSGSEVNAMLERKSGKDKQVRTMEICLSLRYAFASKNFW